MVQIQAISYYLPKQVLTNETLADLYPEWSAEKFAETTGIEKRHIAGENETAGDLAEQAAYRLFDEHQIKPDTVDFILMATQAPDYFLPATTCLLQDRLGIPKTAGALDVNLGCSAYIYGLALAKGLIVARIARNVLLLMADTPSKHVHPMDKSARPIFGDGAAATLVTAGEHERIGEFILGTDGSGYDKLIVPAGGMRLPRSAQTNQVVTDSSGNSRSLDNLFMDGNEVFNFTIDVVPQLVKEVLHKNDLTLEQIDLFVFHQANKFMLNFLRKLIRIPAEKFYVNMADIGNTASATIPIALRCAQEDGVLKPGMTVLLAGFGVGLSWGATILRWNT